MCGPDYRLSFQALLYNVIRTHDVRRTMTSFKLGAMGLSAFDSLNTRCWVTVLSAFTLSVSIGGEARVVPPSASELRRQGAERPSADASTGIAVRNLVLERADLSDSSAPFDLSFALYNETGTDLADITLSISVLDTSDAASNPPEAVVRPFVIRMKETVVAGYSVQYVLRLRRLPANCACHPIVEVIGARVVRDRQDASPASN